jgi:hypothetical protein
MKHRTQNKMFKYIPLALIVFLLVILGTYAVSAYYNELFPTPPGPPTPFIGTVINNNTPTPDETQIAMNRATTPDSIAPSPTIIIISKYLDLSPELSKYEKYILVISHPDGTNDQVLVGPIPREPNVNPMDIPTEIIKKIELKPGDKILSKTDLSALVGMPQPPEKTSTPLPTLPTSVSTKQPYP